MESEITFSVAKEGETGKLNPTRDVIIKITREGFFFKGQKVEDVHHIYERFNEWLTLTRKEVNLD
jgi:hypothetical protein